MTIGRSPRDNSVPLKKQLATLQAQYKQFTYMFCIRSGIDTVVVFTYEKRND